MADQLYPELASGDIREQLRLFCNYAYRMTKLVPERTIQGTSRHNEYLVYREDIHSGTGYLKPVIYGEDDKDLKHGLIVFLQLSAAVASFAALLDELEVDHNPFSGAAIQRELALHFSNILNRMA